MAVSNNNNNNRRLLSKQQQERPFNERILESISRGPYIFVFLAFMAAFVVIWIAGAGNEKGRGGAGVEMDDHHFFTAAERHNRLRKNANNQNDPAMHRCID